MIQRFHDKAKFGDVIPTKDGELMLYADHVTIERASVATERIKVEKLESAIAHRDMEIDRLRAAIEGALAIKSLWVPMVYDEEHEAEAQALYSMWQRFRDVLPQPETPNEPT